MSNLNFPCCCLNSQLLFLPTADTGQNIAFPVFATKTSSYIHPNAIQPALTTVLCRPLVTLTDSLLHPLEIVSFFFFLLKSIEHKVLHQFNSLLTWPTKGGSTSCKWHFSLKLTTVVLGSFSCLPLHLKSWKQAHNPCPAILNKTFSNHFLPSWSLPLTTSIMVPCQKPLSYFDLSSRTQTSRVKQNLPPLFTHGMRNIDQQTSTLQRVSSSTIDIYLTTQNIATDTANTN